MEPGGESDPSLARGRKRSPGHRRRPTFDGTLRLRTWPEHLYVDLADAKGRYRARWSASLTRGPSIGDLGGCPDGVKTTVKGRWERKVLPLPHVVYNRISRRDVEGSRPVRRALVLTTGAGGSSL